MCLNERAKQLHRTNKKKQLHMKLRNILIVLFIGIYSQSGFAQVKKDTIRVLFVGNSFSYYYNLPEVVNAMSSYSDKVYIDTRHSLVGGSDLSQHLNGKNGTETLDILSKEKFDYVVLNHHSLATIKDADTFFETSKKMVEFIRSKGAKPVFMMTWAYNSNPLMLKTISTAYEDMCSKLGVDLVPCGLLFAEVRKWRTDLNMFDDDDKHPSKHATYLNGLSFFKYFTNEKTSKIPNRIITTDKNGQKLYLLLLSQENSDFLQQIVDDYSFKTRLK
jgi:Fe-S-cluster formation regulator IscX/YfhJ